jgi:hypothetical protein
MSWSKVPQPLVAVTSTSRRLYSSFGGPTSMTGRGKNPANAKLGNKSSHGMVEADARFILNIQHKFNFKDGIYYGKE